MGKQESKKLELDVREIEDQRKELFLKANLFLDACRQGRNLDEMKTMMNQLEKQIDSHFKVEERLFKKYAYPDYVSHLKQHRKFIKDFDDLKKVFKKEGSTLRFSMLASYVVSDWLFNHVSKVDKKFVTFLMKK